MCHAIATEDHAEKEAQKNIQTSANKTGGFIPTPPDLLSRDSLIVTGTVTHPRLVRFLCYGMLWCCRGAVAEVAA